MIIEVEMIKREWLEKENKKEYPGTNSHIKA
jgi:hypothetical protein